MKNLLVLLLALAVSPLIHAQACTPAGDESSYGTADTWMGYIYDNADFTSYKGFVNEGIPGNPNFDESFGGDYVNYATNGCAVLTETFSARYKLTKTFASGSYQFMVGADDGYRLSIDGGATWIIDRFYDQSYNFSAFATTLSGTYNLVLEFYENAGGNRLSFAVSTLCTASGNQSIYGTGNIWNGYIYQGTSFDIYNGMVTEGTASSPNFDESFGGSNTLYNTNTCQVTTERFSARYRLQKTFASNNYVITVGGDDGYRLSLDGGNTWVIDRWWDQGYNTTAYNAALSGTYNMVLEYYENGGGNEISFAAAANSLLPVQLLNFNGKAASIGTRLSWQVTREVNTDYYLVERSINGTDFSKLGMVYAAAVAATGLEKTYSFNDPSPANGINYYRLRMVDKDGKLSYSPVIKINVEEKKAVSVFPSVINHEPVYIKTTTNIKNGIVQLFDMNGKQLQQIQLPGQLTAAQTYTLPLAPLAPGNYAVICRAGADIIAKQIIIVK